MALKETSQQHRSDHRALTSTPPWLCSPYRCVGCGRPRGPRRPRQKQAWGRPRPFLSLQLREGEGPGQDTGREPIGWRSLIFQGGILGYLNPLFSHPSERSLNSSFTRSSEVEDGTCFSPNRPEKQRTRLPLPPQRTGSAPRQGGVRSSDNRAFLAGSLGSSSLKPRPPPSPTPHKVPAQPDRPPHV